MSNPFDDLEADDGDGDPEPELEPEPDPDPEPVADVTPTDVSTAVESTAEPDKPEPPERSATDPAESGPAFEYSDVRQKPLYARGETWDAFERNFKTDGTRVLLEYDVLDEETREIHDAILTLAAREPERVAKLILEARRQG